MIHLALNLKEQAISAIWNEEDLNNIARRWCIQPHLLYQAILETGSNDVGYLHTYLRSKGEIVPAKKLIRKISGLVRMYR